MATDPADRTATRRGLAILLAAAAVAGGGVLWAASEIPGELAAATDLVGTPTYADFDIRRYQKIAALAVLGWPGLTLLLVAVLRRVWRPADGFWSKIVLTLPTAARGPYGTADGLTDVAILGAAAGLGAALGLGLGPWETLAAAVAVPAALAFATGGDPPGLARAVAWLAPLGPLLLAIASSRTAVVVLETGTTVDYPWFPPWLAGALAAAGWLVVWRMGAMRAARPVAMLWTGLPLLWLLVAELPGAIGPVDLFHEGEMLVGALALRAGLLPWADLHMIHGPWFDAGRGLIGMALLAPDRWGAVAGLHLVVNPVYFASLAALFAWLFGWRWPHAALAVLLAICLDPLVHVRLMLWAPLLVALALLLSRPTPARALALVAVGGIQAVLVPEAALATVAAGLTVVLHDAVAGEGRGLGRFRRALLCVALAVPVAALLVAGLVAFGAWEGFWHHLTVFTRDHALAGGIPVNRDLPFGDVLGLTALVVAALALVAVGAGWTVLSGRRLETRDWVVIAAALFALLYLPKVVSRADAHVFHVVAAAAVPIGVVAVRLLTALEAALPRLRAVLPHPVVAASLVLLLATGPSWLEEAKASMAARWQYGGPTLIPETVAKRLRPTVIDAGRWPGLGYARDHAVDQATLDGWTLLLDGWAAPGAPVLDMTNRPALFHLLLGHKPVGRFFHLSMALRRESQEAMIADLDRVWPEVVILPAGRGWDGIPDTVRHYRLSRAVLERYVPVEALPDGVLYARRGSELASTELYARAVVCDWGHAAGFLALEPPAAGPVPWPAVPVEGPERVVFRGWAADRATGVPAVAVIALLDGRPIADVVPSITRPDVAAALAAPQAAASGFELSVTLPRGGARRVVLAAEAADGRLSRLEAGGGLSFDAPDPADGPPAGVVDTRRIEAHEGVLRLEPAPGDAMVGDTVARGATRLVLEGGEPGRFYRLADRPPWALRDPDAAIRFGSPRGGRVVLPLGACPQWWGFADRPLYLWPEDGGPASGLILARETAG